MRNLKTKLSALIIIVVLIATLGGCQFFTRTTGGTTEIDLPKNVKLVNVTWKETDIWYLTRPMRADEKPERYEFIESSTFGVMQGKVIISETR